MSKLTFASLAAVLAALTQTTPAETLPGSSAAVKFTNNFACKEMDCGGLTVGKLSATHRFTIDDAVLAQIDSKTSITVNVLGEPIALILTDDPNFVDGATSARMRRTVPIEDYAAGTADITAIANWGQGVFTIVLKGTFSGGSTTGPALKAKDLTPVNLATRLENAGALINETQTNLPLSFTSHYYNFQEASGDSVFREKYTGASVN